MNMYKKKTHLNIRCETCDKDVRKSNFENHKKKHFTKIVKVSKTVCMQCGLTLLKKNFNRHLKSHRSIILHQNVPRRIIEQHTDIIDADLKKNALLYRKIKIAFKKKVELTIMTSTKRTIDLKQIKLKNLKIVTIPYIASCCSVYPQVCKYFDSCLAEKFHEGEVKLISEMLRKMPCNKSEYLNLNYDELSYLYHVLMQIVKASKPIFYNPNISARQKLKFPHRRKKYYHKENVYKLDKKILSKIWNYFEIVKNVLL